MKLRLDEEQRARSAAESKTAELTKDCNNECVLRRYTQSKLLAANNTIQRLEIRHLEQTKNQHQATLQDAERREETRQKAFADQLNEAKETIRQLEKTLELVKKQLQATRNEAKLREAMHEEKLAIIEKAAEELRGQLEHEQVQAKQRRATHQDYTRRLEKHQNELAGQLKTANETIRRIEDALAKKTEQHQAAQQNAERLELVSQKELAKVGENRKVNVSGLVLMLASGN
ncbi:hypothetical protein AAVH_21866 [Aphelenchoides avenae]|nr:hypothetical protein AAVH_21866 [Aphelenchus avenae]